MSTGFEPPNLLGSRTDPNAQARAARQQPLLLHSLSLFRELFEVVFAHRDISTVVEVGVESGHASSLYAELGASTVYCVEPSPTSELRAAFRKHENLELVEQASPEALVQLPPADLYVLDGDHNYATIRREVDWILVHAPDALIACHDVLWPSSRRDQYYEPSELTMNERFAPTEEGPTIWHDDVTPAGFVGGGAFTCSARAGGERNGVLTALEDVLAGTSDRHLELIPAVFGLGIVLRRDSEPDAALARSLQPYSRSQLLATMENNRIALYTRVLQLQYEAAEHAHDADRMAGAISSQQTDIESLRGKIDSIKDRHAQHAEHLRQENRRLTRELEKRQQWKEVIRKLIGTGIVSLRRLARPRL